MNRVVPDMPYMIILIIFFILAMMTMCVMM
jgi:hypothetical protein